MISENMTGPHPLKAPHDKLAVMLAAELINPLYCPETRRSQSVVKEEYIPLLDSWFDPGYSRATYPMNSRGSLARIDSETVEFFVNIPLLLEAVRRQAHNRELAAILQEIERNQGLSEIRNISRDALKIVGKKDYEVEWNHDTTRARYGDLELTNRGYAEGNVRIAEEIESSLLQRMRDRDCGEILILDAGVGTGGTTIPIVRKLFEREKSGSLTAEQLAGIRVLLFDTDERKTSFLKTRIPSELGFPGEKILCAHGEFGQLEEALKEYRGRITFLVSGASICHVTHKRDFFRQAYTLLDDNGSLHIWDPFEPLLFAPRLRATTNSSAYYTRRIRMRSSNGKEREIILTRHEPLPEEVLICQKNGCHVEISGEVPAEDALRFCGTTGFQYLPQLGLIGELIGEEQGALLCREAYAYLMEGIFSTSGAGFFDFIQWMQERCKDLPVRERSRSPYQLIEAVEDREAYIHYMEKAGFRQIQFSYFSPATDYRKTGDIASASSAAIGYITARK